MSLPLHTATDTHTHNPNLCMAKGRRPCPCARPHTVKGWLMGGRLRFALPYLASPYTVLLCMSCSALLCLTLPCSGVRGHTSLPHPAAGARLADMQSH